MPYSGGTRAKKKTTSGVAAALAGNTNNIPLAVTPGAAALKRRDNLPATIVQIINIVLNSDRFLYYLLL